MGSSNSTDYTKQLCFVQNLADDNFGDVEIYRNQQGKYIMKCTKSFITGDRRHLDFKKVLEFMRSTFNKNILSLLYLEQFHQSNVCIEYEKVFVFTEYLNFSLKGLILNKKNIDEPEIWYLLKTMLELIAELEQNDLSMEFSLNNIFLTLKGIPSVFLYHFCCNEKALRFDELANDDHFNQHCSSHTDEDLPSKSQTKNSQFQYKPQNMYFSLGSTILQLINMQIIQQNDNKEDVLEQIKNQLCTTQKKNQILGYIIKEILLQKVESFKILQKIQALSQSQKIKISTEIRFNKFRYVVADDQKIQSKAKDLSLSDKTLMDFKSRPLSAVNTPIYRLKQKDNVQGRESSIRNKSIMENKTNFFKKKITVGRDQKNTGHQHQNQLESKNNFQHLEKEQHQVSSNSGESRRKASSLLNNKEINYSRKPSTNNHHQSKLSLISKRNVSNSKVQDSIQLNNYQSCQLQFQTIKNEHKQMDGDKKPQLSQFYSHKSSQHPTDTKGGQTASQKMKQILNQEISQRSKQFNKTYEKIANNQTQNSLLYKKLNQFSQNNHCYEALKGGEKSKSFFNSKNDVAKPLNTKTQENHNQKKQQNSKQSDKSVLYKPFHTEHNITHSEQYSQFNDGLSQKLKNSIFGLSQTKEGQNKENSGTLRESISNALDRSNFLLTLQIKKQKNNIKTKNITEKKDLILSDMFNSRSINSKKESLCIDHSENSIKAFGSQQIVSTNNILKGTTNTPSAFEKKKVKLKSDKPFYQQIYQPQETLTKNSNQPLPKVSTKFNEEDKQNRIENSQSRISHGNNSNGKLRRLSVRAKTNNLMAA